VTEAKGNVTGSQKKHQVTFYGLSTCIWCKKTREFLTQQGVTFDYTYVDLLQGQEREEAKKQVQRWNPAISFPTVVIDNAQSIVGYKPEKLKEVLGL
jgi:glutaredoxin-like protein NrdH